MPLPISSNLKPFSCSICRKRFKSEYGKDSHVTLLHENAGYLECEYCGKTFNQESHRINHRRIHTGERPFRCQICSKRYTQKGTLNAHHLDMHSEGTFECEICGQALGRKDHLQRHLADHSGERPFQCEVCLRRFTARHNLSRHRLDHHAAKQFKCDRCGMAFGRKAVLIGHLQTHSNERPFECDLCGELYKYKSNLKKHRARHSETARQRRLVQGERQKALGMEVEQPSDSNGSDDAKHNLRVRRKTPNYRAGPDGVEPDGGSDESRSSPVNSSDKQEGELLPQSSTVTSANLKLVFDLEYRAPD